MTKIIPCTCSHEFQDNRYGKGQRVHNQTKQNSASPPGWRCTVCSNEKTPSTGKKK